MSTTTEMTTPSGNKPPAKCKIYIEYQPFWSTVQTRATLSDVIYVRSIIDEKPYGCYNLVLVGDDMAHHQYDFVARLGNVATTDQACGCWLKTGPQDGVNSFHKGTQVLDLTVPVNRDGVFAMDGNTKGGCACSSGRVVQTTPLLAQFASTWAVGEKGADASCIVSATYDLDVPSLWVCAGGTRSTIRLGGKGMIAYLLGMEGVDGFGIICGPVPVHREASFGYFG